MEIKYNQTTKCYEIDDAKIISSYRNFSGAGSKCNREGDRNFSIAIDDDRWSQYLIDEGFNVKIKAPREEGNSPFMYLGIKVKFNGWGPQVILVSGDKMTELNEDNVNILDDIEIVRADLDIRPYDWEANGKTGRAAYLSGIRVYQRVSRFAPSAEA